MWNTIKNAFGRVGRLSGKAISWVTLIMVLTMFGSALMSNLFNISSIAVQESVTWMHALVFMVGAAYTLQHNEHVRVDILYHRWSPRTRAWVDLIGTLIFLIPVCVFILYSSWNYISLSWRLAEASAEAGGLPGVFLLKSLVLVMPALLIIEGLHQMMLNVEIIRSSNEPQIKNTTTSGGAI